VPGGQVDGADARAQIKIATTAMTGTSAIQRFRSQRLLGRSST